MADGIQFILKLFIIISLTESEWIEKCGKFAFHFMGETKITTLETTVKIVELRILYYIPGNNG